VLSAWTVDDHILYEAPYKIEVRTLLFFPIYNAVTRNVVVLLKTATIRTIHPEVPFLKAPKCRSDRHQKIKQSSEGDSASGGIFSENMKFFRK